MSAGWYCAHCGQALPDINVSDRAEGRRGQRIARPVALVGAGVLGLAGLVALLAVTSGARSPAPAASPTLAPVVVAGAPTAPDLPGPTRVPPTPRIVTPTPRTGAAGAGRNSPEPSPGPTVTMAPGQPIWLIPYLARPPQLDGVLDEWHARPVDIGAVVFGDSYWDGPRDLSAQAVAGYDRANLYLGVRVTDDVLSAPPPGERLYLGDSLDLQLDADRAGDAAVAEYNADDFQVGLSPGDFAGRAAEAYVWRPVGSVATGIALASRALSDGYVIEAAIPWRLFRVNPEQTLSLGLALNVSDNDLPEPAQLTMVSTTPNRSWADPRSFGTLVLEPPGDAPVTAPAAELPRP